MTFPSDRKRRDFVEGALGRRLKGYEHIHHIDGNHQNDNLDNLVVIPQSEHMRLHAKHASWARGPHVYASVAAEMLQIVALEI